MKAIENINLTNLILLCVCVALGILLILTPQTKIYPLEKTAPTTIVETQGPEIIELPKAMSSTRPSYSYESSYKIFQKHDEKWGYLLPGGSVGGYDFDTENEVRLWVKKIAKDSYDRWINTSGLDY